MDSKRQWPFALRHAWLTGGIVAANEPQSEVVALQASVMGRTLAAFNIATYEAMFPSLRSLGFLIIGGSFISDPKQLEGFRAPEFRCSGQTHGWPVWDTFMHWRQIASASSRQNAMRLMDVSSRIAAGLQYSELRLYDLAMSYSSQLHSHYDPKEQSEYQAFEDTVSPSVYKDIHALFWEMAVLRDTLAEFIAVFCLSREDATTLSGLRKSLNKSKSSDPFATEIMAISSKAPLGWLARFGGYRDCFTHSAPLQHVGGIAYAIEDQIVLKGGTKLPQIYYALPHDAEELMRRRSQGVLYKTLKELAMASNQKRDRSREPDALEYLHACLCQLTDLAGRLVVRSPIASRPIVITKADIIGEVKVTQG